MTVTRVNGFRDRLFGKSQLLNVSYHQQMGHCLLSAEKYLQSHWFQYKNRLFGLSQLLRVAHHQKLCH